MRAGILDPFFVHELLVSAPGEQVPPSVADAVLARVRRLDPVTQDVLEQLAVVPAALERWLVDTLVAGLAPGPTAVLATAEQRGLLTVSARRITFRHELTRRAIAGAVPAARLIALNQRVLAALTDRPGADVAQIIHHAAQAGDVDAIVAYGPDAARDAARAGARPAARTSGGARGKPGSGGPASAGWPRRRSASSTKHAGNHAGQAGHPGRASGGDGLPRVRSAAGWLCIRSVRRNEDTGRCGGSEDAEPNDADQAGRDAVDRERGQGPGPEVPG